jgi:hypothetical protein
VGLVSNGVEYLSPAGGEFLCRKIRLPPWADLIAMYRWSIHRGSPSTGWYQGEKLIALS